MDDARQWENATQVTRSTIIAVTAEYVRKWGCGVGFGCKEVLNVCKLWKTAL